MSITERIPKGKRIHIFENGNASSFGRSIAVNPAITKNWNKVLTSVTETLYPAYGAVYHLVTIDGKQSVHSFDDLKAGSRYVACGKEPFKKIPNGYHTESEYNILRRVKCTKFYPKETCEPGDDDFPKYWALEQAQKKRRTVIFVFANGQNRRPPSKFVLTESDLGSWIQTLSYIGVTLDKPESARYLYTIYGQKVCGPCKLQQGAYYVAVGAGEKFKKMDYFEYTKKNAEITDQFNITAASSPLGFENRFDDCFLSGFKDDSAVHKTKRLKSKTRRSKSPGSTAKLERQQDPQRNIGTAMSATVERELEEVDIQVDEEPCVETTCQVIHAFVWSTPHDKLIVGLNEANCLQLSKSQIDGPLLAQNPSSIKETLSGHNKVLLPGPFSEVFSKSQELMSRQFFQEDEQDESPLRIQPTDDILEQTEDSPNVQEISPENDSINAGLSKNGVSTLVEERKGPEDVKALNPLPTGLLPPNQEELRAVDDYKIVAAVAAVGPTAEDEVSQLLEGKENVPSHENRSKSLNYIYDMMKKDNAQNDTESLYCTQDCHTQAGVTDNEPAEIDVDKPENEAFKKYATDEASNKVSYKEIWCPKCVEEYEAFKSISIRISEEEINSPMSDNKRASLLCERHTASLSNEVPSQLGTAMEEEGIKIIAINKYITK